MQSTFIGFVIVLVGFVLLYGWTRARSRGVVPDWASFFNARQYELFLAKVEFYFTQKQVKPVFSNGFVKVEHNPGYPGPMGLQNLAQMCRTAQPAEWARVIAAHFDGLQASERQEKELKEKIGSLDAVRDWLAVRVWPESYLKTIGLNKAVSRLDLDGTATVLVWDLPTHQRNVKPEESDAWGKSEDELFAIGLENLKRDKQVEMLEQDAKDGIKLKFLVGQSFLVATRVLLLDQQPGFVGRFGAVTAVPHRHMLVSYPINDLSVVQAINKLIPLVQAMEKQGPGSISAKLYWYQDGHFTNLPYAIADRNLTFTPPDKFVQLVNSLPPPPAA